MSFHCTTQKTPIKQDLLSCLSALGIRRTSLGAGSAKATTDGGEISESQHDQMVSTFNQISPTLLADLIKSTTRCQHPSHWNTAHVSASFALYGQLQSKSLHLRPDRLDPERECPIMGAHGKPMGLWTKSGPGFSRKRRRFSRLKRREDQL